MSTETKTVTVELSVEAAYEQLVGFQTAAKAFAEALDNDDKDAQLAAADDAVEACIGLINDLVPDDLSTELHERLVAEHPELVPDQPSMSMEDVLKSIFGDDFDLSQLGLDEEGK